MPKVGLNIYERRDGRFEGRYSKGYKEDGQIRYGYVYGQSRAEVKDKLMDIPLIPPVASRKEKQLTFADIAEEWLTNASLKVKPSTYSRYQACLKNHILCAMGGCKLPKLSETIIDKFAKDMLSGGRKDGKSGLSAKTVRDMLSVIKSVIDFARVRHKAFNEVKITYPKYVKRSARVLSQQEQADLERSLMDNPDIHKAGIMFGLYTGLRVGELCALRWEDISLENGTVTVNKTLQRVQNSDSDERNKMTKKTKITIDTPKTQNSSREIPLPKTLVALLSRYASNGDKFLLSGNGFNRTEPRTLQNHFKKHLEAAGVASANFHATRHTFATRCVEVGMDIKSISEILGHANVNITLNRYVHSSFDQKREGMSKLNRLLNLKIS